MSSSVIGVAEFSARVSLVGALCCAACANEPPMPGETTVGEARTTTATPTAAIPTGGPAGPPVGMAVQGPEPPDDGKAGSRTSAVCLPGAKPGQVGACVRLGGAWFRTWGATQSGKMPKALATDHAGKRLYSSNMGSSGADGLSVYLTDPLRLERHVALTGNAIELLLSADDRWLWVSDAREWGQLQRFDTHDWSLQQTIAVPGFPKWMTTTRGGTRLFASLWSLDGVSRIGLPEGKVETLLTKRRSEAGKPSKNPRGLVLSADERELYVLNNHDHSLSVIDVDAWKETSRVPIGFAPRHIVAVPGRETFLVSLTGEDAIVEWSPKFRRIVRRYGVGKRPKTIATSQDGRFAYSANFVGDSVTIIELGSGETAHVGLPLHKPSGLAVRADDHFVYVSGFCSNDIWAIERLEEGDTSWEPHPTLGEGRQHRPCLTCASTFAGCPFPQGSKPPGTEAGLVKTDAEWGWDN